MARTQGILYEPPTMSTWSISSRFSSESRTVSSHFSRHQLTMGAASSSSMSRVTVRMRCSLPLASGASQVSEISVDVLVERFILASSFRVLGSRSFLAVSGTETHLSSTDSATYCAASYKYRCSSRHVRTGVSGSFPPMTG